MKALITGITGQDGSFLSELLLDKGYEVHGIVRRASVFNTERVDHLMNHERFNLHHGDVTDSANLNRIVSEIQPDEIYNLAAQSHVQVSFEVPEYTAQVDAIGTLRLLDAARNHCNKDVRFYQASSSELYGDADILGKQNEDTPFRPRSPYAAAKLYAYWTTRNYREAYGMFACNGILFNHESERRGKTFVTRKITIGLSEMTREYKGPIKLGNLDAKRDWGYAREYVEAMWLMMQYPLPLDLVVATGRTCSVREFATKAAHKIGIDLVWTGSSVDEIGFNSVTGRKVFEVDPAYFRPTEVDFLCGDGGKFKKLLNWEPTVYVDELVDIMMTHDLGNYSSFDF